MAPLPCGLRSICRYASWVRYVLLAALASGAACARFEAADVPSDAAVDASTDAGDASFEATDAPPSTCPETLIQDGFDNATWSGQWSVEPIQTSSASLLVEADGGVRGGGLRVVVAPGSGLRFLDIFRVVPSPAKRLCMSGWMRVDAVGGGEMNFFGLEPLDRALSSQSHVLVHQAEGTFGLELRDANGQRKVLPLGVPTGTWFFVSLEADLESKTLTAIANDQRQSVAIDPEWPSAPSAFKVGIPYIGGPGIEPKLPWDVRFDDVRLGVAR